jgi:hypothetical protein
MQGEHNMKKRIMIISMMCAIMLSGVSHAGEIIVGRVIEGGGGGSMIQVGNRCYIVEMVLTQAGDNAPVLGTLPDIKLGSLVQVYIVDKIPDSACWRAEKVVVYTAFDSSF